MPTQVEAQIAGNVWKIEAFVGAQVEEEDVLLILESMKMEIPITAPAAGTITSIGVALGDIVQEGDALVAIRR